MASGEDGGYRGRPGRHQRLIPSPVITYVYNAAGLLQSVTDPVMTTTYTYDNAGRHSPSRARPEQFHAVDQHHTYDGDGNVFTVTDPMGYETTLQYDLLDHLTTTQAVPATAANPSRTTFTTIWASF